MPGAPRGVGRRWLVSGPPPLTESSCTTGWGCCCALACSPAHSPLCLAAYLRNLEVAEMWEEVPQPVVVMCKKTPRGARLLLYLRSNSVLCGGGVAVGGVGGGGQGWAAAAPTKGGGWGGGGGTNARKLCTAGMGMAMGIAPDPPPPQ